MEQVSRQAPRVEEQPARDHGRRAVTTMAMAAAVQRADRRRAGGERGCQTGHIHGMMISIIKRGCE